MKENFIELLMDLVERSLERLKDSTEVRKVSSASLDDEDSDAYVHLKPEKEESMRVITYLEQIRMSKASYQFLMRMKSIGLIDSEIFEEVLQKLELSDSHIVTLEETKWTIRQVMTHHMDDNELAFLDMVLYQQKQQATLH